MTEPSVPPSDEVVEEMVRRWARDYPDEAAKLIPHFKRLLGVEEDE